MAPLAVEMVEVRRGAVAPAMCLVVVEVLAKQRMLVEI